MKSCIFPGSFDPITLGHLDIIERAARIFDKVHVVIFDNIKKQNMFTLEQRTACIEICTRHIPGVVVDHSGGMLVEYAREKDINVIVRGLRNFLDFEYEKEIALVNNMLYTKLETIYFNTTDCYANISSSAVREILTFGGNAEKFLHPEVLEYLGRIKRG